MCKISACKQHRYCYAFCAVSLFHFVFCFLLLLFLTMNPHYMTSYNLVFYCSIKKKETVFAITCVCVHHVCHGYQLCVCCAATNEHIRLGVCQRLSVTSCRLVYSECQEWSCVGGKHTTTHMRTHSQSDTQTDTIIAGHLLGLLCCSTG